MAKRRNSDDGTMALVVIGGGILIWSLLGRQPAAASGLWGILDIYRMPDGSLSVAWHGCLVPTGGVLLSSVTLNFSTAGQTITGSDGTFTVPVPCPTAQQVPAPTGAGGTGTDGGTGSGGGGGGTSGTIPDACGNPISAIITADGSGVPDIDTEATGPKITTPNVDGTDPKYAVALGGTTELLFGLKIQQIVNAGLYPPGGGVAAPVSANAGKGSLGIIANCAPLPINQGFVKSDYFGSAWACQVHPGDWVNVRDTATFGRACSIDVGKVGGLYGGRNVVLGADGTYYVAPEGYVWLPLPSDITAYGSFGPGAAIAVPEYAAGIPAGNYLATLRAARQGGDRLIPGLPQIIKGGQLEKTLASSMAEKKLTAKDFLDFLMMLFKLATMVMSFLAL